MPCAKNPSAGDSRAPAAWPRPVLEASAAPPDPLEAARAGIDWTRSERTDDGSREHVVHWHAECRVAGLCPGKGRAIVDYRDGSPYHQAATRLGLLDQLEARRAQIVTIAEATAKRRALHAIGLPCAEAIELVPGGEP